jgi:hypothetical protein
VGGAGVLLGEDYFFLISCWNLPWGPLWLVFSELELPNQRHAVCGWCFLLRIVEVGCSHVGGDVFGFLLTQLLPKGETGSLSGVSSGVHLLPCFLHYNISWVS